MTSLELNRFNLSVPTGPAPELVNARLAMLGFAGAFGAEVSTSVGCIRTF